MRRVLADFAHGLGIFATGLAITAACIALFALAVVVPAVGWTLLAVSVLAFVWGIGAAHRLEQEARKARRRDA